MSVTGVIRPEFREPLEDLRTRLGVSEKAARGIFLDAVKERMVPMVEWIVSEMEKTIFTQQQLSQRRGKDLGEDYFQSGKGADVSIINGEEHFVRFARQQHTYYDFISFITGNAWDWCRG
jgi:hypothetical protein